MTKIFISHKEVDSRLAKKVADRVKENGFRFYLDLIDDALLKDGPDLSDHLLNRMSECQQLIAVVSPSTKMSWWVPWEIGVGSEKGFRMASYSESYVELPSYLKKWPTLHSDSDIDLYCKYSSEISMTLASRTRTILTEERQKTILKEEASNFHRKLLRSLRGP